MKGPSAFAGWVVFLVGSVCGIAAYRHWGSWAVVLALLGCLVYAVEHFFGDPLAEDFCPHCGQPRSYTAQECLCEADVLEKAPEVQR